MNKLIMGIVMALVLTTTVGCDTLGLGTMRKALDQSDDSRTDVVLENVVLHEGDLTITVASSGEKLSEGITQSGAEFDASTAKPKKSLWDTIKAPFVGPKQIDPPMLKLKQLE